MQCEVSIRGVCPGVSYVISRVGPDRYFFRVQQMQLQHGIGISIPEGSM